MKLTTKQSELLEMIRVFVVENGYPPSVQELANQKKVAVNAVFEMLGFMRKKGAVDWKDGQARTLHIINKGQVMAHSLGNVTKDQFRNREGSYSTHGSRTGANLLGWEEDESELTLAQQREAIVLAMDAITNKIKSLSGDAHSQHHKKSLGRKKQRLQADIVILNKKLGRVNMTSKEFTQVLIDELYEIVPKEDWNICLNKAQKKFSDQLEFRRQVGKGH